MWKYVLPVSMLFSGHNLFANTCQQITDAGFDNISDFYQDLEGEVPQGEYRSKLLRKSVAAFYGDLDPNLSDEVVSEMGEDVGMSLVKDTFGERYVAVNVGFGGGNSATYYYKENTLDLEPAASYDGDCMDQGSAAEFPVEKEFSAGQELNLTCDLKKGSALFDTVHLDYVLGDNGVVEHATGAVTFSGAQALVKGLNLDLAPTTTVRFEPGQEGKFAISSPNASGKVGSQVWKSTVALRISGNKLVMAGKLYPSKTGGFWSKEAVEFKGQFTCDGEIASKSVGFRRIIKY